MIEQVRRFNRTVTERVGALDDHFLGRDRALGEARLLWEIGPDGCEVRLLRARLALDSGYLSRLLRSLEAAGLVRGHGQPSRPAHPGGAPDRRRAAASASRWTNAPTNGRSRCFRRSPRSSGSGSSQRCATSSAC